MLPGQMLPPGIDVCKTQWAALVQAKTSKLGQKLRPPSPPPLVWIMWVMISLHQLDTVLKLYVYSKQSYGCLRKPSKLSTIFNTPYIISLSFFCPTIIFKYQICLWSIWSHIFRINPTHDMLHFFKITRMQNYTKKIGMFGLYPRIAV